MRKKENPLWLLRPSADLLPAWHNVSALPPQTAFFSSVSQGILSPKQMEVANSPIRAIKRETRR